MQQDNLFKNLKLPSNRFESFWDCVKHKFTLLLKIGITLLFFSLPFLIITFIRNISINETRDMLLNEIITDSEALVRIFRITNIFNLLNIIGFIIIGIAVSGILKILKRMIWQESVYYWHDFKEGVSENFRSVLIIFMLVGIFNFILQYLTNSNNSTTLHLAAVIFTIVCLVLLVLLGILIIFQTSLYNLNFIHEFKNAFLLLLSNFFIYIIAVFLVLVPYSVFLFNLSFFYLPVILFFLIIISPLQLLVLAELTFNIFDIHINQYHHQEIYKKGIWENGQN